MAHYDRNNLRQTTDEGIKGLVDDIIGGVVSLDHSFSEIKFKRLQEKILKALEARDEEDWEKASTENSAESYSDYLASYNRGGSWYKGKHVDDAKSILSELSKSIEDIDEEAWKIASAADTKESYQSYLSTYDKSAPDYIGKYVNDAKSALNTLLLREQNDREISKCKSAWETTCSINNIQAYQEFISKYDSYVDDEVQILVDQAKNQILSILDDEDWKNACAENTLSAYKRFVDKYEPMSNKYMSMHLPEAKKKIEEWTQKPDPKTIKWKKWLFMLLAFAFCWFLWIQWQDNAWPFNSFQSDSDYSNELQDNPNLMAIEEVDSLQWAIDSHNIQMLEKYASLDSVRAYFPLANELFAIGNDDYDTFGKWVIKSFNSPDSIKGLKLWNCYALPIVDGLTKSVNEKFEAINWSERNSAERRCLDLYSVYVSNIETSLRLLQQPQRISSLESKAQHYLTLSEGKLRYHEWRTLKSRLDSATNNQKELIRTNYYKMKYDEK